MVKPKFGPFSHIGRDDRLIGNINLRWTTLWGGLKKPNLVKTVENLAALIDFFKKVNFN